jgi:thioesterase domain-containing protein
MEIDLNDPAAVLLNLFPIPINADELHDLPPESRVACLVEKAREAGIAPPDVTLAQAQRLVEVYQANMLSYQDYRPTPYGGFVTLFRAEGASDAGPTDLGWHKLVEDRIEVIPIPGDHISIITDESNVQVLAKQLWACLDKVA